MQPKMPYDREDDVLMIWFAEGKTVDHSDHIGQSILHVTETGEPVLLEILNERDFVVEIVRAAVTDRPQDTGG